MSSSSLLASNLFHVNGLVAVITGGGTGIGLMMAKALALNGAKKVYIIGRRAEVLSSAAKESPHGNIIPIVGDVSSKESLASITNQIEHETGYINVLIANSGILGPQPSSKIEKDTSLSDFKKRFWETGIDEYTRTFEVNTTGVFYTALAFLELLDAGNKKGNVDWSSQVITTSSIGGFNRSVPGGYAYGQSKAAATHLTKQLATGLVPYNIRVNALAPGLFPSELASNLIGTGIFPKDQVPAQRVGSPEEMAGTILFMTSKAGGYCNGLVLVVDGGRLSVKPATY